ncbi:thymocyte nuclear protein 1 [Dunckerocampus dactyliophorus]|uniref:thymocyte nuclear protein 1 n=1 Tax=Dunckerocampus dactyliophorus TaxID=161453 RepID=UPI002404B233|nr:thymocyte nuclear protein 1 [Dunckerocampus dactyliophorus]
MSRRARPEAPKLKEEPSQEIETEGEWEVAGGYIPPLSPSTSEDVPTIQEEPQRQQKKRIRVSKKEIPDYKWTDEGSKKLAEFVKQHPQLFDKKQKDWLNVTAKTQLWAIAGEEQDPPATDAQCKKHYENMRTRVGKILKREKSGSRPADRSMRDEEIMDTWTFLIQHIVRGNTHPNEEFSLPRLTTASEEDDDLSSTGGEVVPVCWRRRRRRRIISKTEAVRQTPALSGHRRIVHDFACLLEGHMLTIPENSWHNFQIECLNLVQKFKQPQTPEQQKVMPPKKKARGRKRTVNSGGDAENLEDSPPKPTVGRKRKASSSVESSSEKITEQHCHWLMKSEPESRFENGIDVKFGIEDLKALPDQTGCWDGVRNYQARNFMRQMKVGQLAFFYHSNCKEPGIAGIMKIVKEAYVDHTQFDKTDVHFDASSKPDNPRWSMVDVQYQRMMKRFLPLAELKKYHLQHRAKGGPLKDMTLFTGARLSVQRLTAEEFDFVLSLEDQEPL